MSELRLSSLTGSDFFDQTHRLPVNKTAALVIGKGVAYLPGKIDADRIHSELCPPIRRHLLLTSDDLTGTRLGRLAVVGMHAKKNGRWVVRCDCGIFEIRTAKGLRNPENRGDRCVECWKVAGAKKHHHYLTTGREIDVRDL